MTTIRDVQEAVCAEFGIDMAEMSSHRRAKAVAIPRMTAMCVARELTPHSLPAIGHSFGNRDHTTVMHAILRVNALAAADAAFAARVQRVRDALATVSFLPFTVADDDFLAWADGVIGLEVRS